MKLSTLMKHIADDQSIAVLDYRTFGVLKEHEWIEKMNFLCVDTIDVVESTLVIYVH